MVPNGSRKNDWPCGPAAKSAALPNKTASGMCGSSTEAGTSTTASTGATGGATGSGAGAAGILILPVPGAALFKPANDNRWVTRLRARSNNGPDPAGRGATGIGPVGTALGGTGAPGGGPDPGPLTCGTGAAAGAAGASPCFFLPKKPKKPEAMRVVLAELSPMMP